MKTAEAIAIIAEGTDSLYNIKDGTLIITDLVDGGDRENEEHGIRAGNGDWLFGIMTCYVDPNEKDRLAKEYGSLGEYALECIPAPGTFVKPRMGFAGIDSEEELKTLITSYVSEDPENWVRDPWGFVPFEERTETESFGNEHTA